jgi:hypothetical protein
VRYFSRQRSTVDNASSVLIALVRIGVFYVAHDFEIEYKGRIIRCRTDSALARALNLVDPNEKRGDATWTTKEFLEFTGRLRPAQRRLLARLLEFGPALLTDEKLRTDLGIAGNQALAGVLSGISKSALALNLEPAKVYVSQRRYRKGKPLRAYKIASGFLRAAKKLGWPKNEDLQADD